MLVERMHGFGTTIFAEMSALAGETDSINLGQGFPDSDGPPELLAGAMEAIRTGHNQYPPGPGVSELRAAVAAHQRDHYGLSGEVLITAGATEAIAAAVLALTGPGDEVVLFEPYYDSYAATIALAGASRRVVTLTRNGSRTGDVTLTGDGTRYPKGTLTGDGTRSPNGTLTGHGTRSPNGTLTANGAPSPIAPSGTPPPKGSPTAEGGQVSDGWTFDPDAFERAITPATRAILLNTPHNPTGKVFTLAELDIIATIARQHDLVVISDEVYEHLTFDGRTHVPIASRPGMAERTLTIGSAGKTFSVTGWKIGWVTGPPDLVAAVRTVKQFLTYVNGAPFQPAVAAALTDQMAWVAGLRDRLQHQRDLLCDGLTALGWDVIRPEATYFATVDVHENAVAFCRDLPHRAGVVAIPSSVFYDSDAGDSYVRFAFCKRPETIRAALARLA